MSDLCSVFLFCFAVGSGGSSMYVCFNPEQEGALETM